MRIKSLVALQFWILENDKFISSPHSDSMLLIVMNSSLLVSNLVVGWGVPYSSDVITDYLKNTLSSHFHAIIQACQGRGL